MRAPLMATSLLLSTLAWAKGEGGGSDVPCENPLSPRAYSVRFPADAGSPLVLATNFGLLVSHDDGATFELICPEAIERFTVDNGLQALYSTPTMAVMPGGVLLVTRWPNGLLRSPDGCAWEIVDDPIPSARAVSSLTLSQTGTLFTSFSTGSDPLGIAQSPDGLSFTLTSAQSNSLAYDGVMAADDGTTLYGITTQFAATTTQTVIRSTDTGGNWTPMSSYDTVKVSLGSIDALDEMRLLLRQRGSVVCAVTDTLLLSEDGGASTTPIATLEKDPLTGAIFRPGGEIWIASMQAGVAVSSDNGQNWAPAAGGPTRARCLAGDADSVIACLPALDPTLGLVAITRNEGASWQPLVTWENVIGSPACLADTCATHWQKMQNSWIDPVEIPDGGNDGLRFDMGDGVEGEGETPGRNGCGCAIGSSPRLASASGWLLALVLCQRMARAMRRRKSSTSASSA